MPVDTIRLPDFAEIETLGLVSGAPVLVRVRVRRDAQKRPLETSTFVGADRISRSGLLSQGVR